MTVMPADGSFCHLNIIRENLISSESKHWLILISWPVSMVTQFISYSEEWAYTVWWAHTQDSLSRHETHTSIQKHEKMPTNKHWSMQSNTTAAHRQPSHTHTHTHVSTYRPERMKHSWFLFSALPFHTSLTLKLFSHISPSNLEPTCVYQ